MMSSFSRKIGWHIRRRASRRPVRAHALTLEALERRELLTAFNPGDLIILRSGDGTAYSGTAPLFLDEYTTSGSLVRSIPIPFNEIVGGPGNQPITIDLSAAAGNGQLNRSYDGSVLTFGGVDSDINSTTATGSADRVIAISGNDPDAANFLDTTTHGQFYVGDDNRGAIAETANGPIWAAGHPNQAGGAVSQGVHYFPVPGPSIGTQVSAGANIRGVTIGFDNRLYFSTAGSTQTGLAGIYSEAQSLPVGANPSADVPVVSALFSASKLGGIYLADVNQTGVLQNGDRLYFLDDGTVGGAGTGGIYVSSYNTAYPGNHWSTAVRLGDGIIDGQPNPQPTAELRGLTGTVIDSNETDLYVTEFDNVAGNNSYLLKYTDTHSAVNIASASEAGNVVTITTALPNGFTTGQRIAVDGVGSGTGSFATTDGYNGSWIITVVNGTTFTYTDTNPHGTGLATVMNQGAADVAVNPTTLVSLANGSVTIGSNMFAAQGLRGVAFAPVAPTTLSLTVNGTSSARVPPGTPVTFVATLANAQVTPSGAVTFIDQNTHTVLGQGTIVTQNGVSTATLTTTLVGNHFITAYFAGGGAGTLASASSGSVTVIEAGSIVPAVAAAASLPAAALGLPVTITATLAGGSGLPTGTVSFYGYSISRDPFRPGINVSELLGSAPVDATGAATFTTSFTQGDIQIVIAVYNGDDTYAASQTSTSINTAPNAVATITSSANQVPVGSTPTYTATLTGNSTLGTPSGTVRFFVDGVAVGTPQTLTPGANNTATASVTSTPLTAGSHFVTIAYMAASPFVSFAINTTTTTNGVAFIETAQQPFHPGNLVAVQRGDGSVNLGSSGYLVFLDEYTPGGTLVQQIALPNVDSESAHALLLSGQSGAEGLLNRSADGYYLTLAGYDVPVGRQFVTSTFPFQYARTIARIDQLANVDTSTAIATSPDTSVPYNPLDVVSNDGNEFWLVSNLNTGNTTDSGILYVDGLGENSAMQIGPVGTHGTSLAIAGGQLYAASTNRDAGTPVGVWQVGTGLPTSSTTLASLPGLADAYQNAFPNAQNPEQLLFFNHLDGTSNNPDTLFIADQSNGLLKFWFDGTTWHYGDGAGRFGQKLVFAGGATGVVGYVANPGPNAHFQLFVTGSNVQGQNPNQIAAFADANTFDHGFSSGNFSTVAFVGATGSPPSPNGNENFAGLAFVPGYHTSTALMSSNNPAMQGSPVTFSATVTATMGIPTGVVTFFADGSALGTAVLDTTGVARLTTNSLSIGDHVITVSYNGDVADGISVSDPLVQTIFGGGRPTPRVQPVLANPADAGLAPIAHWSSRNTPVGFLANPPTRTGEVAIQTSAVPVEHASAAIGISNDMEGLGHILAIQARHQSSLWSLDFDDSWYSVV